MMSGYQRYLHSQVYLSMNLNINNEDAGLTLRKSIVRVNEITARAYMIYLYVYMNSEDLARTKQSLAGKR